jgi:glutamate-ammonia-ligase adenylyltransferase
VSPLDPAALLTAAVPARRALVTLRRLGFADPRAALANLHALTPTPPDAERLAPVFPRLLAALAAAPDPDMALNNLERLAAVADRAVFFRTLGDHPGAIPLLARLLGSSQFLADALRRRPNLLPWLLEPRTMRPWLTDDLEADLAQTLAPFATREAQMNALRRFKYRQLLRIASRDLLGDADLTVTTEELSRLADVCLGEAWRLAEAGLRARYGAPLRPDGGETGLAVIAMGKLGGEELNYASDIDLMFVYGEDGETEGGADGRLPNGEYFARLAREIVAFIDTATDEGYAFRVDLRLRPEGRLGPLVLALDGYRAYWAERAETWERQALLKARACAGDEAVGAQFVGLARQVAYRSGTDERAVAAIRAMKREIDRHLAERSTEAREANVKLGRGGIREIEFLVQALQLLYGGDDPWLRERNTLKALYRLTERGYLAPDRGRALTDAYVHLRTVEHRLQILHEFQTHTLPADAGELGRLARRVGLPGPPRSAARLFDRRHRAVTGTVHRAFREFFAGRRETPARRPRLPSVLALRATGFGDPERARENLRLIVEGRPLVPWVGARRRALERLLPALLDAVWKTADPDTALDQFERFLAAVGPRVGLVELLADSPEVLLGLARLCAGGDLLTQLLINQPELLTTLADPEQLERPRRRRDFRVALAPVLGPGLTAAERRDRLRRGKQAEELAVVWRYLLGVTDIDGYSREMTDLAEAVLTAGLWLALEPLVERHGVPRTADGRFIPAVLVGLGKLGGRELTTGSDLDVFLVYAEDGHTDGPARLEAHTFWSEAVERLAGALGDITAAGVAFPVDLRLRPGSKGSGFASSLDAAARYWAEYGDLWERQMLTRARVITGDPALARRARALIRRHVYGEPLGPHGLKEIAEVRARMELELGRETPGRRHVKFGRGGLVDVEFVTQALQLLHGAAHPEVRWASTRAALGGLARVGALPAETAAALEDHYRFLRRVSASLRLLSARPPDTLDLAGPMPGRVASALGYPSREAFLEDYRRRTEAVRAVLREHLG